MQPTHKKTTRSVFGITLITCLILGVIYLLIVSIPGLGEKITESFHGTPLEPVVSKIFKDKHDSDDDHADSSLEALTSKEPVLEVAF
ncbi:MAG: hypothetical protein ACRC2T_02070, partial [Thermoguttaceae bacterium]